MNPQILPPPSVILEKLSLSPSSDKKGKSPFERSQYRAITNWITRYRAKENSTNLAKVESLLQAFTHLCDLQQWQTASQLLALRLNTPTQEDLDNQLHTWGYYTQQIALYEPLLHKLGDTWNATLLNGLGIAHNSLGNHHRALAYHQQQSNIAQTLNKPAIKARVLGNTGVTYHCLGQYSQAIACYQQQLGIGQQLNSVSILIQALAGLGSSYYQQKQYGLAITYYQQQHFKQAESYAKQHLVLVKTLGDLPHEQMALTHLGNIHAQTNMRLFAVHCFQDALSIAKSLNDAAGQSDLYEKIAYLHLQQQHWEKAISHYQHALSIAQAQGELPKQNKMLNNLGAIYLKQKQPSDAVECFEQVVKVRQQLGDPLEEAKAWVLLGKTLRDQNKRDDATVVFQQARKKLEETGDPNLGSLCETAQASLSGVGGC